MISKPTDALGTQRKRDFVAFVFQATNYLTCRMTHLHVQPVQAPLAQRPPLRKLQDATADVRAEVVEVAMHRIRASAEVQVVREVQRRLIPELLRNLRSGCGQGRVNCLLKPLRATPGSGQTSSRDS